VIINESRHQWQVRLKFSIARGKESFKIRIRIGLSQTEGSRKAWSERVVCFDQREVERRARGATTRGRGADQTLVRGNINMGNQSGRERKENVAVGFRHRLPNTRRPGRHERSTISGSPERVRCAREGPLRSRREAERMSIARHTGEMNAACGGRIWGAGGDVPLGRSWGDRRREKREASGPGGPRLEMMAIGGSCPLGFRNCSRRRIKTFSGTHDNPSPCWSSPFLPRPP
jgi:hypothetical protein